MRKTDYLKPVPDSDQPEIKRLSCPVHGVQTYTLTVIAGGFLDKKGRFDGRTGSKRQICITCLIESGGTKFQEVGQ